MKKICKKLCVILALAFAVACLSGCYDNREIDSLADVIAVGVEHSDQGTHYTFAVADTAGFSEGGDSGSRSGTVCYTADSSNTQEAIDFVNSVLSKKLNFSHLTIIIAKDSYAEDNLEKEVKFFGGMSNVRPQTLVAVSEFSPGEYLQKVAPVLEVNTEKYFLGIFENKELYVPSTEIKDYMQSIYNSRVVFVPLLCGDISADEIGEQSVRVDGVAFIEKGKVNETTKDYEILGLFKSKNYVNFSGTKLKSAKLPQICVTTKDNLCKVSVSFTLEGCKNENYIKSEIKKYLYRMAKKGYDVADARYVMRKNYAFYKDYKRAVKNFDITKCKFDVKIKSA